MNPTSLTISYQFSHSLCPTLCNPIDYSLPGSSVYVLSQARILEWVVILSPKERNIGQRKLEIRRKNLHMCVVSYFCTVLGDVKVPFRLHEASITVKSTTTPRSPLRMQIDGNICVSIIGTGNHLLPMADKYK